MNKFISSKYRASFEDMTSSFETEVSGETGMDVVTVIESLDNDIELQETGKDYLNKKAILDQSIEVVDGLEILKNKNQELIDNGTVTGDDVLASQEAFAQACAILGMEHKVISFESISQDPKQALIVSNEGIIDTIGKGISAIIKWLGDLFKSIWNFITGLFGFNKKIEAKIEATTRLASNIEHVPEIDKAIENIVTEAMENPDKPVVSEHTVKDYAEKVARYKERKGKLRTVAGRKVTFQEQVEEEIKEANKVIESRKFLPLNVEDAFIFNSVFNDLPDPFVEIERSLGIIKVGNSLDDLAYIMENNEISILNKLGIVSLLPKIDALGVKCSKTLMSNNGHKFDPDEVRLFNNEFIDFLTKFIKGMRTNYSKYLNIKLEKGNNFSDGLSTPEEPAEFYLETIESVINTIKNEISTMASNATIMTYVIRALNVVAINIRSEVFNKIYKGDKNIDKIAEVFKDGGDPLLDSYNRGFLNKLNTADAQIPLSYGFASGFTVLNMCYIDVTGNIKHRALGSSLNIKQYGIKYNKGINITTAKLNNIARTVHHFKDIEAGIEKLKGHKVLTVIKSKQSEIMSELSSTQGAYEVKYDFAPGHMIYTTYIKDFTNSYSGILNMILQQTKSHSIIYKYIAEKYAMVAKPSIFLGMKKEL